MSSSRMTIRAGQSKNKAAISLQLENKEDNFGLAVICCLVRLQKKDVDLPFATDRKIGKFMVGVGVFFLVFFLHIFQKLIKSSIYSQI